MGRSLGAANSQDYSEVINIPYVAASVTQALYIAPFPVIVTSISGRQRVNGGSGAQATFYKCASGVAAASGSLLHTGIFDASTGGTADANQTLTLVTDQSILTLNTGDSINVVWGGTLTAAVGMVQVVVEPVN